MRLDLPVDALAEFCRRNQIRRMSVFGSALRDDFGPNSDVDLLVEFEPESRVGLAFFGMEEELSQLLRRKVDLNTPGFLSPHFRDRVMGEAEPVYVAS